MQGRTGHDRHRISPGQSTPPLAKLEVPRPYVLAGHSIAGFYTLAYANRYRNDVSAVIGIHPTCARRGHQNQSLPEHEYALNAPHRPAGIAACVLTHRVLACPFCSGQA
jgi:pimeloyl-ACP methyl ester carboxylesterase